MNVNELYAKTKQIMFEKGSSTIYDNFLIENLNRVIDECFHYNNMERMFKGLKPLEEVPYISNRDDLLIYEDVYTNYIMPLGLASYFLIDDDLAKYGIYNTDYRNALIRNQKFVSKERIDALRNS